MVNLVSQNSHQQTQAEHMENLDSYLEKGNNYKKKEQWEDAIACYRTFLETNPENWQTQQSLGDCLINLKRWEEASEAYRQVLKVKPDFVWAHHNLGIALIHLERFEEAYECFEKVREQKPDFWDWAKVKYSAPLQQKLGDYLFKQERWEEAVTCYRILLKIEPENWEAQHHLGDCLINLKRWEEASEAYREALKVNPDFVWAHHNLGIALVNLEQFEEAYGCFEKVKEQKPDFWDWAKVEYSAPLQCKLGDYLLQQQRWEDAAAVYRRVIRLNPDFAWGYVNLGRALQELKEFEKAVEVLQKAVKLNPSFGKFLPNLHNLKNIREIKNFKQENTPESVIKWKEEISKQAKQLNQLKFKYQNAQTKILILENINKNLVQKNRLLLDLENIPASHIKEYNLILESDLFDVDFYLKNNPEVKKQSINPVLHYLKLGHRENKKPNQFFDTKFYREKNLNKSNYDICPLIHFIKYGRLHKIKPSQEFDSVFYLDKNPDVVKRKINPLVHYLKYGQYENRLISSKINIDTESKIKKLKFGFVDTPIQCLNYGFANQRPKNKKRILIYSHNLKLQGAPISLSTIVMGYLNKNLDPVVFTSGLGTLKDEYEKLGIKVIKCNFNNERYIKQEEYDKQLVELKETIIENNIDSAHINTLMGHHIIHACYQLKIPTLLNIRESVDPINSFQHWSEHQQKMSLDAYKLSTEVVFVANKTKSLWDSIDRDKKARVIHNSIIEESYLYRVANLSKSECRSLLNIEEKDIVILSVATISARKGQKDLINCLTYLTKLTKSKFRVVLIGGNEGKYCQEISETIATFPEELQDRIKIVPETRTDEGKTLVSLYYLASDIFVLNSRNESYPRVILEAMLFSLSIVSTPNFGVVEQVKENENALFYEEGNCSDLAQKISVLLNSSSMRMMFSKNSRKIFGEINSYDNMIKSYSDLINI